MDTHPEEISKHRTRQGMGVFGTIAPQEMSGGGLAGFPGVRIDFSTLELEDFLPDTDGEFQRVRGFTLHCASCPDEFFSIIFLNDESQRHLIPEWEGDYPNDWRVIPIFLNIGAEPGVQYGIDYVLDQIVAGLSDDAQRVHFTNVTRDGMTLIIEDVRRGNLPGATYEPPYRRGRLDTYVNTGIFVERRAEFQDPTGLWIQTGANSTQGMNIYIERMDTLALGLRTRAGQSLVNVVKESGPDISRLVELLDDALEITNNQRANLGAMQNRLDHAATSVAISSENLSDAESRIRNADMAREMMDFMQMNVLFQAGMLMLTQANQSPNAILRLLQN